jgi:enoyl-CoA hydratase/carnithine racemase
VRDGFARLTRNRSEVYTTLDATKARELAQVVGVCAQDAAVRAVFLTGAGKAVCAGGDMRSFHAGRTEGAGGIGARVSQTLEPLHEAILGLTQLEAPVIAGGQRCRGWWGIEHRLRLLVVCCGYAGGALVIDECERSTYLRAPVEVRT